MSSVSDLAKVIEDLEERKLSVDDAIAETEARLKMLRAVKAALKAEAEPRPKVRKEKVSAA